MRAYLIGLDPTDKGFVDIPERTVEDPPVLLNHWNTYYQLDVISKGCRHCVYHEVVPFYVPRTVLKTDG